ncbi:16S rRNA (guanine(527)-N(7))-methyltransferase RsmG [uncultured Roseovarius sp.]|uniref:16S rRNA (guanine(527)-N(7))-methyltransferase RsmG n=1 Tax=uncultured Roseovarius sp. TaxID=293344 RepID=UPI000C5B7214|nr:16S rRNA (guanine(527)-N(7))-methyltransferase RsmG [Roseovarius sp.]MBD11209.1 16S rRNA (guanine(527)-N(7))-methyltransferase RsmG [Roseovarius sp.]
MTGLPDVSRETQERLEIYGDLLTKWNPRINLVSKKSLEEMWTRHFADSAQIYAMAPHPVDHWVDMGSGGGFPGLVVAILGQDHESPRRVTLIESDARKAAFLRVVIREAGLNATVLNERIEKTERQHANVLSARALTDLNGLLAFAERHLAPDGVALFPKGVSWENELTAAERTWCFNHRLVKSATEDGPVIFAITGVSRA